MKRKRPELRRNDNDQRVVDALRAILGMAPLYATDKHDLETRMARAMTAGLTDGNSQRASQRSLIGWVV